METGESARHEEETEQIAYEMEGNRDNSDEQDGQNEQEDAVEQDARSEVAREHSIRKRSAFPGLLQAEEYLSVREAARLLGVSTRSVYGYIETGKLLGIRIGASIAVQADAVRNYERQVVGRPRSRTPVWRIPTTMNLQYLTNIHVRVRAGQSPLLEKRMEEMRKGNRHLIPGTVARYIVRNQANPDEVQVILVWRHLVMPPAEVRATAVAAFQAELADILDWEHAVSSDGRVVLNA
jgi:excisionase family DNA binding protein